MRRYWLHTLGCPKNQVDSAKLAHRFAGAGYRPARGPSEADVVVVNTCAFVDAARQESIDTVLALAEERRSGARLVVTGCLAERYGNELAQALPEVDLVAGFGAPLADSGRPAPRVAVPTVPVTLRRRRGRPRDAHAARPRARPGEEAGEGLLASSFDLLEAGRGASGAPWAYVKVAEGCDRRCGFCAIPSFRGPQRSRDLARIMAEVHALVAGDGGRGGAKEIVLVAQDLASYGLDRTASSRSGQASVPSELQPRHAAYERGHGPIVGLVRAVSAVAERTRLLYLYPSALSDPLVDAVLETGVPYFDLSLQHASRPLLSRMRRWGDGAAFLRRIDSIRRLEPDATFRSSFIVGYPGETERDHDRLLGFLEDAQLDWAGFFPFSPEEGTHAASLPDQVPAELARERIRECAAVQDAIMEGRRRRLVGRRLEVLVDRTGVGRSVHEAPEIDGVVHIPSEVPAGCMVAAEIVAAAGSELWAQPIPAEVSA